jgi:hypothetical protein
MEILGHEVAVHDVHVDHVRARLFHHANFLAQPREIRGQDRRGDFDACVAHAIMRILTQPGRCYSAS